tara:strand:+ start:1014 stop:1187 length:174 start_codon:yes stop_codon:yes gene_type:complete
MKITVQIKSNYGQEMIYPVSAPAKIFADLAGTKTLTRRALQHIAMLGYTIEVQPVTL